MTTMSTRHERLPSLSAGETETNIETETNLVEPSIRDERRERLPTQRGYSNTLETKTAAFRKETSLLQKAIDNVHNAFGEKSTLGEALKTLETTKSAYQSVVVDLEKLFEQDRWGETIDIVPAVRETSRKYIQLASDIIAKAVDKLSEIAHKDDLSSKGSRRSRRSSRTGSSNTSSSSARRLKALADAAAAREQAEYDLLIAQIENTRRQREAEDERSRAASKAEHDHEIAVLKAKKITAVANAKLNAIEQSILDEEKLSIHSAVGGENSSKSNKRTYAWVENQRQDRNMTATNRENVINPYATVSLENRRELIDIPLKYKGSTTGKRSVQELEGQRWNETTTVRECVGEIAAMNRQLTASLARQALPNCHPDTFSGDVTMFHPWKNAFKAMIQDADVSSDQEICYLHKYTRGEPQRLVDNFRKRQHNNSSKLLKELWVELERRFGNTASITRTLLERLRGTARFEEKDKKKLQEFSDLCTDVDYQLGQLPGLACLNYPNAIHPIVQKLPIFLQRKWEKEVVDFALENNDTYPNFHIFVSMIDKQAKLKNHPNIVAGEISRKKSRPRDPFDETTVLKGETKINDAETVKEKHCPFHNCEGHTLTECNTFERKTLQEKTEWIMKAGLCFRCLSDNHIAKDCKAIVKCTKCSSDRHLLLLHLDQKKGKQRDNGEEINSACTELCGGTKGGLSCSKIVLVDVFLQDNNVQRVYALLDEQSNASMISPELVDKLGIVGRKEKYFLSTCSGSKEMKHGRRVPGLTVTSMNGRSFKLPTLIECDHIPKEKREIPTPEIAKQFTHLQEIASEIPPLDPKAEISILIGRDAPEIMKVRAFKNGPKGAPWAQRLAVGWTVCGQVCLDRIGGPIHISTHRTTVYDQNTHLTDTEYSKNPKKAKPQAITAREFVRHDFTPCPNKFVIKEMYGENGSPYDVYHTTSHDDEVALSVDDRRFIEIMEKEIRKNKHGNWEMPLPFRSQNATLPNNRGQAVCRLDNLLRSFGRKPQLEKDYFEFMAKLLKRGNAVPVPSKKAPPLAKEDVTNSGKVWYLPHFGVYHPKKPTQIRVVFDSSAEYQGVSLNKELLPGPDVLNSLQGVLIRFRREDIAIMCDIEQMFHCFHVHPAHRDTLRFLWFMDNDRAKKIVEYHMVAHLFGNTCSPAIATFGLRKTADDGEEKFGRAAKEFVHNDFYVDDGLTSCPTEEEAIALVKSTQAMLTTANIRLHKIVSNSVEVMEALPSQDRVPSVRDLDLHTDPLPAQRSLGVYWNLAEDAFTYRVSPSEKPYTRRGVLAVVNSVYDPLGFATPVTLKGRLLLRKLVAMGNKGSTDDPPLGWDDPLPENLSKEWQCWRDSLIHLESLLIPRCYHPKQFGDVTRTEIHAFSDASQDAIGVTTYLRQINLRGEVSVSLVFAQAKLAPKQATTIPRLELCGAVLSTQAVKRILKELRSTIDEIIFYTDSKVVLGYIQNESKRFYVYVANRVQIIRAHSHPSQWRYIDSAANPADLTTRSITTKHLPNSCWFKGPEFLSTTTFHSTPADHGEFIVHNDPEIRPEIAIYTMNLRGAKELNSARFKRFSKWSSLRRALANLIVKARECKTRGKNLSPEDKVADRPHPPCQPISQSKNPQLPRVPSAAELRQAEVIMITTVQNETFATEIGILRKLASNNDDLGQSDKSNMKKSDIYRLDPFLDKDGTLRVGGRLRRSSQEFVEKHPAIMPKGHHLSNLVLSHYHEKVYHQGRIITHGAIRQAGFWVIGASRMISKMLSFCVTCRKLRGKVSTQHMADLPSDRMETPPPFTNVGFDVFGPWIIHTRKLRGGAVNSKRWGLVFTCLNSRAIHIEVLETMDSSSFICALRRFLSIRGPVLKLRCDRGTNFIGGKSELDISLQEMDHKIIEKFVTEQNCEWLFNPPHASHFGGVWERQIGTIRRILDAMFLKIGPSQLTHELLSTLMAEVTGIVNARPIALLSTDTDDPQPLTPAMLLTMKTRPLLPPPGVFVHQDLYSRRRWRKTQYLADQFWVRWRHEYLQALQPRPKWNERRPNLQDGDIVIIKTEVPRNRWLMGRIIDAIKSEDNKVRKARVMIYKDGEKKTYVRPISELVLLLRSKSEQRAS